MRDGRPAPQADALPAWLRAGHPWLPRTQRQEGLSPTLGGRSQGRWPHGAPGTTGPCARGRGQPQRSERTHDGRRAARHGPRPPAGLGQPVPSPGSGRPGEAAVTRESGPVAPTRPFHRRVQAMPLSARRLRDTAYLWRESLGHLPDPRPKAVSDQGEEMAGRAPRPRRHVTAIRGKWFSLKESVSWRAVCSMRLNEPRTHEQPVTEAPPPAPGQRGRRHPRVPTSLLRGPPLPRRGRSGLCPEAEGATSAPRPWWLSEAGPSGGRSREARGSVFIFGALRFTVPGNGDGAAPLGAHRGTVL